MTVTRTEDNGLTLILDRLIDAPRPVVWRCWTEADLLKRWYCPAPWWVSEADLDPRVGGRMNCVMQGPAGERIDVVGCILEVVDLERLTFTDAFTEGFRPQPSSFMTGFVNLYDEGEGQTRMIWGARHSSLEDVQKHLDMGFEGGWTAASGQLNALASDLATKRRD
jgi:uncharacterized protein YndB with AHSA1/START domain